MRSPIIASAVLIGLLLSGCTADFNWRETSLPPTPLRSVFPCKPERVQRTVELAGQSLAMHMTTCTTAGVTTAVGHAGLSSVATAGAVLRQWREATLKTMAASDVVEQPWSLAGTLAEPQPVLVQARGRGTRGEPLRLRAAWFSEGTTVYAAMVFGENLDADVAETFLSGLRLP